MLVIGILDFITAYSQMLDAKVYADYRSRRRKRTYLYISAANSNKVFAAGILRHCGRQDAPLDLFADLAFNKTQLWQLDLVADNSDVVADAFGFIALMVVALRLELRISRLTALLDSAKEVAVSLV